MVSTKNYIETQFTDTNNKTESVKWKLEQKNDKEGTNKLFKNQIKSNLC
jgi:hypothetical protein